MKLSKPKHFKPTEEQLNNIISWVAALRSGDYEQGRGRLVDTQERYCCLGVACQINNVPRSGCDFIFSEEDSSSFIPKSSWFIEKYGFHFTESLTKTMPRYALYSLNDDAGYTFNEIADIIENIFIKGELAYDRHTEK